MAVDEHDSENHEEDGILDEQADGLEADGGMDDLFGEDEDDLEEPAKPTRNLDDEDLDSGDDEDRMDRAQAEGEGFQYEEVERLAMDIEFQRQPLPEPTDGELYLLKIPHFLAIEPQAWQTTTFQPPTNEHHSKKPPPETFSAFNTAMTTIRWRHSPSNPSELQSNARINRWSDGSLTLQLASDPKVHYEVDCHLTAPPQINPKLPTPASAIASEFRKDQFTYLVVPVESAESLRVTHKVTAGLQLRNPQSEHEQAIQLLKLETMQLASTAKVAGVSGDMVATEEDPELGRKRAEIAERSAMRDRKKRENAQERERLRTDRAMGRAGLGSTRYGGLNVGMLEDDEMDDGETGGRTQPSKARAKPRRRRNSEYSEDEDFGRKRFTREDSYDQEDDFLAPSDEEEVVEDDEDPDDGIIEEARQRSPKRDRPRPAASEEDGDADADADADGEEDEENFQAARTKRRRVVDEDDDE